MRRSRTCCFIVLIAPAIGCTGTAPAALEAPPPPVYAVAIQPTEVVPTSIATAEILANRQSDLRSEIAGRVMEVLVEAGDRVEEGQVLLRLDVGRPASAAQAANEWRHSTLSGCCLTRSPNWLMASRYSRSDAA